MINACHTCKWLRKKENFENNISTVHIIWCSFILNWIKVLDITFLSKCANIKFERQEYSRWSKSTTCSISTFHTVMPLYVLNLLHVVQNMSLQPVVLSLCLISFSQLRDLQTKWQGRLIIPLSDFTSNLHSLYTGPGLTPASPGNTPYKSQERTPASTYSCKFYTQFSRNVHL